MLYDLEVIAMIVQSEAGPSERSTSHSSIEIGKGKPALVVEHSMNVYFTHCMNNLLETFAGNADLLKTKGSFIIR